MADGGLAQAGALDGGTDVLDVLYQNVGVDTRASLGGAGASHRVTVQVLATNRDTDHQLGKLVAVLLDGGLQSGDFVVHATAGGPETQQQRGLLVDSGLDGLGGGVGSASLLKWGVSMHGPSFFRG